MSNFLPSTIKRSYTAKLLLFGEYSLLVGGSGIAYPLALHKAIWQQLPQDKDVSMPLQSKKPYYYAYANLVQQLAAYWQKNPLGFTFNTDAMLAHAAKGWYLFSNIPTGYGLGSSGALAAALYSLYANTPPPSYPLTQLQAELASIENYFHGNSSGIDPLVSYLNTPIMRQADGKIELLDQIDYDAVKSGADTYTLFLVNSQQTRSTAAFVKQFLAKLQANDAYKITCSTELVQLNERCINYFLQGDITNLYAAWQALSTWQFQNFSAMIPAQIASIWQLGLQKKLFALKLCGAGGGGYFLGMCPTSMAEQLPAYFGKLPIHKLAWKAFN